MKTDRQLILHENRNYFTFFMEIRWKRETQTKLCLFLKLTQTKVPILCHTDQW